MPTRSRKRDPKFVRSYDRSMLRSAFLSLFWGIITERRKRKPSFTLQGLAKVLGTNKAEVSRWFNGDPNWTINTIAAVANALNVELSIQAVDRETGAIFTPAGLLQAPSAAQPQRQATEQIKSLGLMEGQIRVERIDGGVLQSAHASIAA